MNSINVSLRDQCHAPSSGNARAADGVKGSLGDCDVAIIGMAGLFPGSNDLAGFWQNLIDEKIFLSAPPSDRFGSVAGNPIFRGGFLEDVDRFDADFFRMSPREASRMDPQQRLLLQVAWQVIEDAGYTASALRGAPGGVFVGAALNEYAALVKDTLPGSVGEMADVYFNLAANRLSHSLGLRGPSELIQTACSGSMVAIHRAISALHSGECEFAIAGAVNLCLSPDTFFTFDGAGLLSKDGTCLMFDDRGNGFLRGEGVALVMLKLRSKAVEDRDHIHALLKGSAVRHSGTARSLLSLNFTAQVETAVAALGKAGVSPASLHFVEIQGSGKSRGDRKELDAVIEAMQRIPQDGAGTTNSGPKMLGCLKSNYGHLESVSAVAGVIKVALALRHHRFPGIAALDEQHSSLAQLQESNFNPFGCAEMESPDAPLRASVNGFGFGGTNGHLVMEEWPTWPSSEDETEEIIVLSARNPEALRQAALRLRDFLYRPEWHASISLADIAFTLQSGREEMKSRIAIVADSKSTLLVRLDDYVEGRGEAFSVRGESPDESVTVRLGHDPEDQEYFARLWTAGKRLKLAALWTSGACIDWDAMPSRVPCKRASLPTYPFEGKRHWVTDLIADEESAAETSLKVAPSLRELVLREVRQTLGLPQSGAESSKDPLEQRGFESLGVDSLLALRLQTGLERKLNVAVPLKYFLDNSTPGDVIAELLAAGAIEQIVAPTFASGDAGGGNEPFPLTDIQLAYFIGRGDTHALGGNGCHLYWEFEQSTWNIPRLEAAWQKLVERHDMLRAVFTDDAQQRVLKAVSPYHFEVHDFSERGPDDSGSGLLQVREQLSHQCFEAGKWPLFAIAISKFSKCMRLHFSLDLLIADGLSIFLLLREWADLYEQPGLRREPPAIAFRDYVLDLQKQRDSARYAKALAYWRARLPHLPAAPALPILRETASFASAQYKRHESRLDAEQWTSFKAYASGYGLTASAGLLAAFSDVLARWSESESFTLNLTVSHRAPVHPEIHTVIGDFTSNILLEVQEDATAPFRERAARLRNQLTEDLDHALVSGVQVLGELSRQRKTTVLMPVVFTSFLGYTGAAGKDLTIDALGKFITGVTQTPQVWLDAQVAEMDGGLYLSWDCVDAMFPAGLPSDMFRAFAELVNRLACDAACWNELRPARLPQRQTEARLAANRTETDHRPALLHQGFLDHAQRDPQRAAVIASDANLTYGELRSQAAWIARKIQEAGVKKNSLVAIVMDKSAAQVISAVAILMAGAAYLPVDPSLPEKRLRELLEIGEVSVVLTRTALASKLSWPSGVDVLSVDGTAADAWFDAADQCPATPDDLAYVIFTSGSTGVPKGVMIQHAAAANTVRDINERFGVNQTDSVLALSSLSFDLSVYDIFGVLAAGGVIVMPDTSQLRNPEYLAGLMERRQVTIWNSVPSYLQMLVESGVPCRANLRLAMLSGDWIPVSLPAKIERSFPGVRIVSLGGATEASIWSIYYLVENVAPDATSIPYGRPLANQRFHVLNSNLENCPEWTAGELYISGDGLANGYWKDDVKTSASFPLHPVTAERLYRTGDWGRYLPDGSIEFLGRRDLQVKIGGHRVELGELESVLAQYPGVREAMAVTFTDEWNQKRLAAVLTPSPGVALETSAVRDFVKSHVAEYMVPKELRVLTSIPLTPNGKVDRKTLEAILRQPPSDSKSTPDAMLVELQSAAVIKDVAERRNFVSQRLGFRRDLGQMGIRVEGRAVDSEDSYARLGSIRQFSAELLEKSSITGLLSCLRGVETGAKTKYLFPSAGDSYSVQTYLEVKQGRARDLPEGLYYYHPLRNELQLLGSAVESASLHFPANQAAAASSAFVIYLVADLTAIRPLYGKFGKDFCQIEAGHMGQLLRQAAADNALGLCPVGYLQFEEIRNRLGLGQEHHFIYAFLGGAVGATVSNEPVAVKLFSPTETTGHEHVISKMWSVVLKLESPAPLDVSFFELGGNSFAVLQLHKLLTLDAGLSLSVTDLFRYPTVQSLAAYLRKEHSSSNGHSPVPPSLPAQSPKDRRELRRSIRTQIFQDQRS
jgi:amino acid adenylation domain-containing protein